MPRRFDKRGWNRQFKWQPVRRGRWDPFPKDHLPFVDDFSMVSVAAKIHAGQDMKAPKTPPSTPAGGTKRPRPEIHSGMKLPDFKRAKTSVKKGVKRAGHDLYREGKRALFEYTMWKIIEMALAPETGGASIVAGEGIEMASMARRGISYGSHLA